MVHLSRVSRAWEADRKHVPWVIAAVERLVEMVSNGLSSVSKESPLVKRSCTGTTNDVANAQTGRCNGPYSNR